METKRAFLQEIESETQNTRRVLERIETKDFDFKPHEKSMTLGELATHIVELHNWVSLAITKQRFDFHENPVKFKIDKAEDLMSMFEDGYESNKSAVESFSDEDLHSVWTLSAGDHIITQVSKIEAFRFIIQNHLIHHRGQLTVYLRLLNIAVPGLYGPSSDERFS